MPVHSRRVNNSYRDSLIVVAVIVKILDRIAVKSITRNAAAISIQPRAVTLTEAGTGAAHLVTDEAMTAGLRSGRYPTVCGAQVLPASLTVPASGRCPGLHPVVVMSLSREPERIALRRISIDPAVAPAETKRTGSSPRPQRRPVHVLGPPPRRVRQLTGRSSQTQIQAHSAFKPHELGRVEPPSPLPQSGLAHGVQIGGIDE